MNLLKAGGAVLALLLVLLVIAPQEKLDRLGLAWSRAKGNPGILCLDYQRQYLKDPVSAELLEQSATKDGETSVKISIKYRAKNSYGAYQTSTTTCVVTNDEINEVSTEADRTLQELAGEIAALDESTKCLEKRNALIRSGDDTKTADSKLSARCLEIINK